MLISRHNQWLKRKTFSYLKFGDLAGYLGATRIVYRMVSVYNSPYKVASQAEIDRNFSCLFRKFDQWKRSLYAQSRHQSEIDRPKT